MDVTPTTQYLIDRIHAMTQDEVVDAIKLVRTLPGGKRAIAHFVKTLTPQEKKAMQGFVNFICSPFDLLNSALEAMVQVVYLLP